MICFPATNRVHLARQKLLLNELERFFDIDIYTKGDFVPENYDAVLIRGDRYELLPLAVEAAYKAVPIFHIEGGDLSGVIDNKVRYAITHLSDYHFCTNEESHRRLIQNGVPTDRVWNFGSLDVEFAKQVKPEKIKKDYILVAYHPVPDEDENEIPTDGAVIVGSNKDYGRKYGSDEYLPEDYINLIRYAKCCVGNSSSFIKEASILGTPVVLVGDRQQNRLLPKNVLQVPCERGIIKKAIEFQSQRVFEPDFIYYKPNTSKNIAQKIYDSIHPR